jgi:hypothetical protein
MAATRRIRRWLIVLTTLAVVVTGLWYGTSRSLQYVPDFYEEAVHLDPEAQRRGSEELLERVTAMTNDARRGGSWEAIFTNDQINGWMAVDMQENHPDLLPPGVTDPRVVVEPQRVRFACRYEYGRFKTVYNVELDLYMPEPNLLAVRINKARAGILPVPIKQIVDGIAEGADRLNLQVQWLQTDGDPVALIRMDPKTNEANRHQDDETTELWVETIELRDGEVFLAGRRGPEGARIERLARQPDVAYGEESLMLLSPHWYGQALSDSNKKTQR